jgi:hypothetical protein
VSSGAHGLDVNHSFAAEVCASSRSPTVKSTRTTASQFTKIARSASATKTNQIAVNARRLCREVNQEIATCAEPSTMPIGITAQPFGRPAAIPWMIVESQKSTPMRASTWINRIGVGPNRVGIETFVIL